MSLPPVVERELRVAFRKQQPVKRRSELAAGAAVATILLLLLGLTKALHWLLFLYGLVIVLRALPVSASLFSEERRNQTLELLFLTGMTAPQLFVTKLVGGLLITSSDLLTIIPFLSIPFLAGGLSLQLFVATLATLPTLLLFTVSVGVLASVICHDDGTAVLLGSVIIAVLCLLAPLPYNLGLTLTNGAPFSSSWLCLSPAYAPWLITENFGSAFPTNFWPAILTTLSWSLACFGAAAAILTLNWRNDPKSNSRLWRRKWDLCMHGGVEWRRALRKRLLSNNAFRWRIQQDRLPAVLAWMIVAGAIVLWSIGWLVWADHWLSTTNFFTTAAVIILALYWLELHSAAHHIARERRDGTLELLLTTPLQPAEILDGLQKAFADQLRPVRRTALVFFCIMAAMGFCIQPWNPLAVAVYLILWAMLGWFVIARPRNQMTSVAWVALISGRAGYALKRLHNVGYFWLLWLLFYGRLVARALTKSSTPFPEGTVTELIVVSLFGIVVLLGSLIRWGGNPLENSIAAEMRTIAQRPILDPQDPRFRKWKDIRQRFPWSA